MTTPDGNLQHVSPPRAEGEAAWSVIPPEAFERAAQVITSWQGYAPTPLFDLPGLAEALGVGHVLYKHEGPRFGLGSFKALGAAYAGARVLQRVLAHETGHHVELAEICAGERAALCQGITLVTATDGNHGRSLAWGCARFGAACRIYVHAEVSAGRTQAMEAFGAEVVRIDGDYDASVARARTEAEAKGWHVVSDTSWPGYTDPPRDVMAGYGLIAQELCDQWPVPPTHVFVQGGVGGLAAGIAARLRQILGPDCPRLVVVEPDRAACLFASARAGRATTVAIAQETIMAGLSCGEPSELAWQILREETSDFLAVPDDLVPDAMRRLARPVPDDPVIEAGESAVAGLVALMLIQKHPRMARALDLTPASRVVLIGSEGVTDPEIFARIMEDGIPE